jgi:cytidylate kinase
MYRAITWLALHHGISLTDTPALAALARSAPVTVSMPPPGSQAPATIHIGGLDATPHLRDPEVERSVSAVSAVPEVREVMVDLQRQAAAGDVVMAGRDIGTVVLPHAEVKVFLAASAEVRAHRRVQELAAKGLPATYDDVLADLRRRDAYDSARTIAPLRPADDAVQINTDNLTLDQVVEQVLALVQQATRNVEQT